MSGLALWLLVALPAALGAALCLAGPRGDRLAAPAALGGAAAVAALGVATAISRPHVQAPFLAGEPFSLGVDALSAVVVPTVAVIALLVLVFAAGERPAPEARFYGLMLLFTAAVEVTATAESLLGLLFAWEVMGATSYALIGYRWRELDRPAAGANAFLTTRLADLGLYVAAGAALAGGSGLSLSALGGLGPGWRDVAAGGLLVAALGKAAQLPFTPWLSRAMEGPSAVSALLHSAAMVAMGGYLLLRASPLLLITGWAATTAAWVGALTALLLGAVALAQRDLKQVLAASTAAQLGFVVLAAGVGSVAGGAAQLVAHAATKALLFLAAGAWLSALGTKQLGALRGAARRWPVVGAAFAVGALSLAGIPPLSLWATKDAVLAGARETSAPLYLVGLGGAVLSAAYAVRILVVVWSREPADAEAGYDDDHPGTRRVGAPQQGVLVALAVGAAVLGALALPPVGAGLRAAVGAAGQVAAGVGELALSASLALVVGALVVWRGGPELGGRRWRWAQRWLGLDVVGRVLLVTPVRHLSHGAVLLDDRIDRAVTTIATTVLGSARGARRVDTSVVDAGAEGVAAGAARVGALARRTQTGQLHQYYAQVVAVLAVATALLLLVR